MGIKRLAAAVLGLTVAAIALGAEEKATPASSAPPRDMTCYVAMEEGASSEGNALFLQKMGIDPEVVKTFAPLRFERKSGKFSGSVQGRFGYQADSPRKIASSGKVALYEVPVRLAADPPPKAWKTVSVTVSLQELSAKGGLVQPSVAAMDKAAAAQKLTSGTAWIVEMSYAGKGKLKAKVGLAK